MSDKPGPALPVSHWLKRTWKRSRMFSIVIYARTFLEEKWLLWVGNLLGHTSDGVCWSRATPSGGL